MRNLPVFDAFTHALKSVWQNLDVAVKLSWAWYAIILAVTLAAPWFLSTPAGGDQVAARGIDVAVQFLVGLFTLFAVSSVAVSWHRYILLDETPAWPRTLRSDDVVWRYFGNTLLLMLMLIAVGVAITLPLALIAGLAGLSEASAIVILTATLPFLGAAFLRFSIKLPALALGRSDFSFADAWRVSAGSALQTAGLFVLNLLLVLGLMLPLGGLAALLGLLEPTLARLVLIVLQIPASWFLMMFGMTMLTSLYGFFVEKREF